MAAKVGVAARLSRSPAPSEAALPLSRRIAPEARPPVSNSPMTPLLHSASTRFRNASTLTSTHSGSIGIRHTVVMPDLPIRAEEHSSDLQSLMRISYVVFCLINTNIEYDTTYLTDYLLIPNE